MLAVFIKTFRRDEPFFNTVSSVRKYINVPFRIYVCDDGPVSHERKSLYGELKNEGHRIILCDEEIGAAAGRILMVQALGNEEFVLRMDDDFEVSPNFNVARYINLLRSNPTFGVLSGMERQRGNGKGVRDGQVSYAHGFFRIDNDVLYKDHVDVSKLSFDQFDGVRFIPLDFGRNMLLIKREMFEAVMWDERISFAAEHEDFLLQVKNSKYWKYLFVPEITHVHRQDLSDLSDAKYRQAKNNEQNRQRSLDNFSKKWGIQSIRNNYTMKQKLIQYKVFVENTLLGK